MTIRNELAGVATRAEILRCTPRVTYWQNLQVRESEFPPYRRADAQIILVGADRRTAVIAFVNMKPPPKILHDLDSQI